MIDYCTAPLNLETKSDIIAACIQAEAALRGAHEQAMASLGAGVLTLVAGTGALFAGWLAYKAATMQTKLEVDRERDLTLSYRRQMIAHINAAEREIRSERWARPARPGAYGKRHDPSLAVVRSLIQRLSPANWQELARAMEIVDDAEDVSSALVSLVRAHAVVTGEISAPWDEGMPAPGVDYSAEVHRALEVLGSTRDKLSCK